MADKYIIDDKNDINWYVVNTYAGLENRVRENLIKRAETMGIQDCLLRVVIAERTETEIKNGKEVEKVVNLYPGYIFVEMKMTDQAWYVVRNTQHVTGFIGSSGGGAKPFPVDPAEMEAILRKMGQSDRKIVVDFAVGDTVKILNGPFTGMTGRVSTMNDQTQTANVMTMLFGRETPTDISYNDLEKVTEE